jgi:hypothetical protein
MAIDDWFWLWCPRHRDRFPRGDWPSLDAEFWVTLRHIFITKGVTEDVAERASMALFTRQPEFVSDHPRALLEAIREIWRHDREAAATRPVTPADLDGEEFDRKAYAHWATVPEAERQEWRDLAFERCPELCRYPTPRELMAIAWAYDPRSVVSPRPPSEPRKGPRPLFDPNTRKV